MAAEAAEVMVTLALHVTCMELEMVFMIVRCNALMLQLQIHGLVMDIVMMVHGVCT
tara:strand:+ start:230 stop:397 length:168 start_codon:yes stop_codon:yes gene_type:complete